MQTESEMWLLLIGKRIEHTFRGFNELGYLGNMKTYFWNANFCTT